MNYFHTPFYIFCGLFCGVIASLFLFIYTYFLTLKKNSKSFIFNRYFYITIISITLSVLTYPFDNFNYGYRTLVSDLVNNERINDSIELIEWKVYFKTELFVCIIIRLF